jgi:signal transduction histidine kinase
MRVLIVFLSFSGLIVGAFLGRPAIAERVRRFRVRDEQFRAMADAAPIMVRVADSHPSRLHALGLVAAIGGFCQELWSQQGLQVRFTHEAVPRAIPGDVALCLYRIVQESLQNVIKQSGGMQAEVHLAGSGDRLLLRITDPGGGFAPERRESVGLGLLSMRERVHSVGGDIVIQAAPGRGTRIGVRVGLQPTIGENQPA